MNIILSNFEILFKIKRICERFFCALHEKYYYKGEKRKKKRASFYEYLIAKYQRFIFKTIFLKKKKQKSRCNNIFIIED